MNNAALLRTFFSPPSPPPPKNHPNRVHFCLYALIFRHSVRPKMQNEPPKPCIKAWVVIWQRTLIVIQGAVAPTRSMTVRLAPSILRSIDPPDPSTGYRCQSQLVPGLWAIPQHGDAVSSGHGMKDEQPGKMAVIMPVFPALPHLPARSSLPRRMVRMK